MPTAARSVLLVFCMLLAAAAAASSAFVGFTAGNWQPRRGPVAASTGQSTVVRHAMQTLKRTKKSSEWRLSVGHAIDVLRRDLERFTDEAHTPDFSIFSEDIVVEDARLPSFRLQGLATYQRVVSTLKWSVRAACVQSRLEITAMQPPVNGELYMRWRLQLIPRDVLASAKDFLAPAFGTGMSLGSYGEPLIVEGYSRYEFHPWTAEIVKHTIDITNPPMLIVDLLRKQQTGNFVWAPAGVGVSMPNVINVATEGARPLAVFGETAWSPSLPTPCEDDFECNDGRANFPLQCCEVPILGSFCCEPEDFLATPEPEPAYVPLPVPVDEARHRGRR